MAELLNLEEIRGKDTRELRFDLEQTRKALFHARFQTATDAASGAQIRGLRRTVARILTVLGERERAGTETQES